MRTLTMLLASALVLAAPGARADEASDAAREAARRQMDLGHARFEASDFGAALEAYRAADATMNVPTTKLGVARALVGLGRLVEARGVLEQAAKLPVAADEPAPFRRAREEAGTLYAEVADRIGTLRVEVSGPHETAARVELDGNPVSVDEARSGRAVDPGPHRVRVAAAGFEPFQEQVEVAPKGSAIVRATLRPTASGGLLGVSWHTWSWVGVGVGAAALVTGTVTGGLALHRMGQLEDACPQKLCTEADRSLYDGMNALANTSNVLVPFGVLALAGGVTGLVLHPAPTTTVAVGPGSITLGGRF